MAAVFLTRARVKSVLGIPTGVTRHDTLIDNLLEPSEQAIYTYLGVAALTQTTYNETHDIEDVQNRIRVKNFPIVSVAALTNNGSAVAAADFYTKDAEGYVVLSGTSAFFAEGRQKVSVSYDAGFSPVPERFVQAGAFIASYMFNRGAAAGFESEKQTSYSYKVSTEEIPAVAKMLLNGDRRIFA